LLDVYINGIELGFIELYLDHEESRVDIRRIVVGIMLQTTS
jgi:hypothetical protein|tara:strand:- start:1403 stop:1525 length:123 start_codon:yes stop_codon:yes gene_type:complete